MEEMKKEEGQGCCQSSKACCSGAGCCGAGGGRKLFCGALLGFLLAGAGLGLYYAGKCSGQHGRHAAVTFQEQSK